MEQVGVEAIVEGLAKFQSDMGKLNSSLGSLRPQATLLQRAFGIVRVKHYPILPVERYGLWRWPWA